MTEQCLQIERIATIEQRLKGGDGILDTLTKEISVLTEKIMQMTNTLNILSNDVCGKNGILEKINEHEDIIMEIKKTKTIEKVEKHDRLYIGLSFLIGFAGITNLVGSLLFWQVFIKIVKIMN